MKTLTIVSTLFIPLGFIAGLYGMNFKIMPELRMGLRILLCSGTDGDYRIRTVILVPIERLVPLKLLQYEDVICSLTGH